MIESVSAQPTDFVASDPECASSTGEATAVYWTFAIGFVALWI